MGTHLRPDALEVLFEDNHLLVVHKPAGVLAQADASGDPSLQDTAKAWIKQHYDRPGDVFVGIVHRLDRPVSGVVILARTSKAAARLSAAFRDRKVEKRYLAVVLGGPKADSGDLIGRVAHAGTGASSRVLAAEAVDGKAAVLAWQVRGRQNGYVLLEVRPTTGRRHQIRAQLAEAGWPILGDLRYGAPAPLADRRVALHALAIRFPHPTRDEIIEVEAPLPPGWPWPPPTSSRHQPAAPVRPSPPRSSTRRTSPGRRDAGPAGRAGSRGRAR